MLERLLADLRREAGWENLSGATNAALELAKLPGEGPVAGLWNELVRADGVDLADDAGDVGDELWRLRSAVKEGLVALGQRSVPFLRARVSVELSEPRHHLALDVLAQLHDVSIEPIAEAWALDVDESRQRAGVSMLGHLRIAGTDAVVLRALATPPPVNGGWLKRIAAVALARLGNVEALEVLLDDADWFARLGVAEGLAELQPRDVARLRRRLDVDADQRVRDAARRGR